jgi:hypothetical protein
MVKKNNGNIYNVESLCVKHITLLFLFANVVADILLCMFTSGENQMISIQNDFLCLAQQVSNEQIMLYDLLM